jgi:hypothetical protein
MQTGSDGGSPASGPPVEAQGIVQRQGITFYQYGSHVLADLRGETRFALQSADPALLDRVIGRHVRVSGRLMLGYPVDMGPPLIDVQDVADAGSAGRGDPTDR